jgi:CheY-like chemotaxis protein
MIINSKVMKILIADDAISRRLTQKPLERAVYEVLAVENGISAAQKVSNAPTLKCCLDRLVVMSGGTTRFVRVVDIEWIEGRRSVSEVARCGQRATLSRGAT